MGRVEEMVCTISTFCRSFSAESSIWSSSAVTWLTWLRSALTSIATRSFRCCSSTCIVSLIFFVSPLDCCCTFSKNSRIVLSTIAAMDRLVVMDKGRIIEEGTHAQLLRKKGGVYASLWARQSGGFLIPEDIKKAEAAAAAAEGATAAVDEEGNPVPVPVAEEGPVVNSVLPDGVALASLRARLYEALAASLSPELLVNPTAPDRNRADVGSSTISPRSSSS